MMMTMPAAVELQGRFRGAFDFSSAGLEPGLFPQVHHTSLTPVTGFIVVFAISDEGGIVVMGLL